MSEVQVTNFYIGEGSAQHELFTTDEMYILYEGVAGSGKTRSVLEFAHYMIEQNPNLRVAFIRQERKELTTSILPIWEDEVLGKKHPAVVGASAENRSCYRFANGAVVDLHGLDQPMRLYSSQYDILIVFEAIEVSSMAYESLKRAMRGSVLPDSKKRLICECNPGEETHWLNVLGNTGGIHRIKAQFRDNPKATKVFVDGLASIRHEATRKRLYEGEWITAEGLLWDTYSASRHLIDGELRRGAQGQWKLWVPSWDEEVPLYSYFCSVDWGYSPDPGVLQVWGVDALNRAFRVREIYRRGEHTSWWAERAAEYCEMFQPMYAIECDPSRPGDIKLFNSRLERFNSAAYGRDEKIAGGANNNRQLGHKVVREAFAQDMMFLVRGVNEHVDTGLRSAHRPFRTEDEIPGYRRAPVKDGQASRDDSPPDSIDHGCDCLRYSCVFHAGPRPKTLYASEPQDPYPAGSAGRVLGHAKVGQGDSGVLDDDDVHANRLRDLVLR